MTGYTVHTGATEKFSEGWDRIFGGNGRKKKSAGPKKSASKAKRSAKKKTSKKPKTKTARG